MTVTTQFHYTPEEAWGVTWPEWLLMVIGHEESYSDEDDAVYVENVDDIGDAFDALTTAKPKPRLNTSHS